MALQKQENNGFRAKNKSRNCEQGPRVGTLSGSCHKNRLNSLIARLSAQRGSALALTLGIFLAILLLIPGAASAYKIEQHDDQVTGDFGISPTKTELQIDPGQTVSQDVIVYNRTGKDIVVNFSSEDYVGTPDASQDHVLLQGNETSGFSAKDWLTPEVDSIPLKQGETLTMPVKVSVPDNAESGGHYAALVASSTDSSPAPGSNLRTTSRVTTMFLIRVSGPVTEAGSLDTPDVPGFSEYGPISIGLVFRNTGNIHLKPSGKIRVKNFFGQTVAEIPVSEWIVLPQSARRTAADWSSHFLFGRYTAEADIDYGSDNSSHVVVASSFWVIPWKIILAVISGIIVLLFLVSWATRGRRQARADIRNRQQFKPVPGAIIAPDFSELAVATAGAGQADGGSEVLEAEPEGDAPAAYMSLSDLFPSMNDNRVVNISDVDTKKLLRTMIDNELDLARAFVAEGKHDEARRELEEARYAAQRLGLLAEVGIIDDMMKWV